MTEKRLKRLRVENNEASYYAHNKSSPLTLEGLAEDILQAIFEYLNPPHLLTLCRISRYFYWPATICLYQQIIITKDLEIKDVRKDTDTWVSRKFTVTSKPELLMRSVFKNKVLASMIKAIIIDKDEGGFISKYENVGEDEIENGYENENEDYDRYVSGSEIVSDFGLEPEIEFEHEDNLWYSLLKLCDNIQEYHNRGSKRGDEAICALLHRATFHVDKLPQFGPHLKELRIVFKNHVLSKNHFVLFAISMINTNAYVNLKTLIKENETPWYYGSSENHPFIEEFGPPPWIGFFGVFKVEKIKLCLDNLRLCGYLHDEAEYVAKIVREAVNFKKLKTSELTFTEDPHEEGHESEEWEPGFLDLLTEDAKSLKHLYLNIEIRCTVCFDKSTDSCVKDILCDQLETLSLHTGAYDLFEFILESIKDRQRSLRKLEIGRPVLMRYLSEIPLLDQVLILSKEYESTAIRRQWYTPYFSFTKECKPHVSAEAEATVRTHLESLNRYLEKDFIVRNRDELSSELREYCLNGFNMDMRRMSLILNKDSLGLNVAKCPNGFIHTE